MIRHTLKLIILFLIIGAALFYFKSGLFITNIIDHIFEIIGIIIIPLALMHERREMKDQQKDIHQQLTTMHQQVSILEKQEILNAWMILNTQAPGNGGKKDALEFLAKACKDLVGINVSGNDKNSKIYLNRLNLGEKNIKKAVNLGDARFNYAILKDSIFEGANLRWAQFNHSILWNANFQNADLRHTRFYKSDLRGANFHNSKHFNPDNFDQNYITYVKQDELYPLPTAPDGWEFRFLMKGGRGGSGYQKSPSNINDIYSNTISDSNGEFLCYFIKPMPSDCYDSSTEK